MKQASYQQKFIRMLGSKVTRISRYVSAFAAAVNFNTDADIADIRLAGEFSR
jgi:hypothetical protein